VTTILSRITGRYGRTVAHARTRYERTVAHTRTRYELLDHAFRAKERYGEALAGRLAAAVAYYGFFATFAFLMLAYSVLGFLVEYHVDLRATVEEFLRDNIPVVAAEHISAGRGAAGIFGLFGMLMTGVAWVEALRASQRRIWGFEPAPGSVFARRALDVVVLAVLAILLFGSFALTHAVEHLLRDLPLMRPIGWLFTIGVDLLAAMALMVALPRLRISARRLLPAAVLVAVGIFVLNTVGRLYILRIQDNPAYAVVATAAGLLVYLYLFHQLVLAGAAWAATSRHGRVADLAAGRASPRPAPDST
jgi:membrane protein